MDLKFEKNEIGFNSNDCMAAIRRICDEEMDKTADKLVEIVKNWIKYLGNGTKAMKWAAQQSISKIVHDIGNDSITIGVGVDEINSRARSAADQFYVRAMVVIYGNQGSGPLWTKPGKQTFGKEVFGYSVHVPADHEAHPLPDGFNQGSVEKYIQQNSMKEIEKYFKDMLVAIDTRCSAAFYQGLMTGG